MTEEIIIDCAFYKDGVCASPINKTCEYCKNIDVSKCYHKQLKRLEQLKNKYYQQTLDDEIQINNLLEEIQQIKQDRNVENITRLSLENRCLEQENKELKKQIESQKGLITVGGKQQYKYLQEIDKLQQENKELKEFKKEVLKPVFLPNIEEEVTNKYRSALEEILESAKFAQCLPCGSGNLEDCINCNDDTTNNGQFCMEKRIHEIKTKCVEVLNHSEG